MAIEWQGQSYEELRAGFRWRIPELFNMGLACSDDQPSTSLALVDVRSDDTVREVTFGRLAEMSNRFANGLHGLGIRQGDRVGVVVPQSLETAVAHLGTYKAGAVAVPLSVLFGPEALRLRLGDAGARAVVTVPESLEAVVEACMDLETSVIVVADHATAPHRTFDAVIAEAGQTFDKPRTAASDPGLLIYTSGTTGPPKGALHGHQVLLGHMPGFDLMFDFFGRADDRMWTPADWAWIGGLLDAVLPTFLHGRPVLAAARKGFDPDWAIDLMDRHRIRAAFLPPTGLKLMRQAGTAVDRARLRTCMSGGEPLGEEMLTWAQERLGVTINEIYGQTEANLIVGNSHTAWKVRPGSMGRPFPGHDVAIIDAAGEQTATGEVGEIAVRGPDPVMFLQYWGEPELTRQQFTGDWLRTGDLGLQDDDGYLWFRARADDVINSAGYRIGPADIEDCLLGHAAVAMAAVVGVPDSIRGQAVKAFVQLRNGHTPDERLAEELQSYVRSRLSAHEYPRLVEFVTKLPMTTTGKIRRSVLRSESSNRS